MNTMSSPATAGVSRVSGWPFVIGGIAMGTLAISNQSFWIDEANTAWKAMQPTFADWWLAIITDRGSDLQMPLYQIYIWVWAQIFGVSEVALRAANLPWFWLGMWTLWRGFEGVSRVAAGAVIAAMLSPFGWYYLNDARPYGMQMGVSLVIISALWRLSRVGGVPSQRRWIMLLCGGVFLLSGSSLLGMIFSGALLGAGALSAGWRSVLRLIKEHWGCWATLLVFLFGLATFYLWTLKFGARASSAGKTDLRNVMFVGYELLGFGGLGPGRNDVRSGGWVAFRGYVPMLAGYAALLGIMLWIGARRLACLLPRTMMTWWLVVIGATVTFLFTTGVLTHFRVLGRHFSPMFPIVALVVGCGLKEAWGSRGWMRGLAVTFLGMVLASAFELRFADRHAKDGYREAAAIARMALARGESVWWSAELRAAQVYGVAVSDKLSQLGQARLVINPSSGFALDGPAPACVISSKPDLYDATGTLVEHLLRHGYETNSILPAFVIWKKARYQRPGNP